MAKYSLRYFASLRERMGKSEDAIESSVALADVAALVNFIEQSQGEAVANLLREPNILIAVNQQMVKPQAALNDGDEVAFFPPVTGG